TRRPLGRTTRAPRARRRRCARGAGTDRAASRAQARRELRMGRPSAATRAPAAPLRARTAGSRSALSVPLSPRTLASATVNVLVLGSGGREHTLVQALSRDPAVTRLVCAPGNAGTVELAEARPVDATDPAAVVALAQEVEA